MKNITVIHNGGGWITNIGNAFLDFGSMQSIKEACSDADVHLTSVLNRWISYHLDRGIKGRLLNKPADLSNVFNLQDYCKADYITQSGAFLAKHWFDLHGQVLLNLREKGIKLIINGGGMTDSSYNEEEIAKTRNYLEKLKPYLFISRDKTSFENYKDLAEHAYNGIDVAFFLSDFYKPLPLDLRPYIALNFDKEVEPNIKELDIDTDAFVVRTHHSFWHNFALDDFLKMKSYYYNEKNTLISEIPQDYLNIYANADKTYSDRVHACVATFSYGNPARLFSKTPRSLLFDRIGASEITKNVFTPDMAKIKKEKEKQVSFLSEVL